MLLSLLAKMLVVVVLVLGGNVHRNSLHLLDEVVQDVGIIVRVEISPDSIELEQGETFQFTAYAYDQEGNQVEFTPIWLTTGGEINQSGEYSAINAGCYEVLVTDAHTGIFAVAKVHIACHQSSDACLVIDPGRVELSKGETIQFTALGYDDSGGLKPVSAKWESGGGWIDEKGIYTASEVGEFLITATQVGSTKFGTAHVTVRQVSFLPPWMYLESGKWWFTLIGILIGLSLGMGYYLYKHNQSKTE